MPIGESDGYRQPAMNARTRPSVNARAEVPADRSDAANRPVDALTPFASLPGESPDQGVPAGQVTDPCTGATMDDPRSWRDWLIPVLAIAGLTAWMVFALIAARDPDTDVAGALFVFGTLALVVAVLLAAALPLILAALPTLPGVAAIATVALTLNDVEPRGAVLAGAGIMVAAALLLAALGRGIGRPDRVNPRTYADLQSELDTQCSAWASWCSPAKNGIAQSGCSEAAKHLVAARQQLASRDAGDSRWITGSGYVAVAARLHRVEEELLLAIPIEALSAAAEDDALRIVGSPIGGGTKLAKMLETVRAGLTGQDPEGHRWHAQVVRRAINKYRDDRAEGLVRAKNRLVRTIFITGGATYLLLALALWLGAPKTAIGYVSALYLVGAVVGLFLQLRSDAKRDSAVEDYGLATVRLVHIPLLSGIAAVAGVGLTGLAGTQTLGKIFDIVNVPTMLIIAATFGLTPGCCSTSCAARPTNTGTSSIRRPRLRAPRPMRPMAAVGSRPAGERTLTTIIR
jgi:hypothetical protein